MILFLIILINEAKGYWKYNQRDNPLYCSTICERHEFIINKNDLIELHNLHGWTVDDGNLLESTIDIGQCRGNCRKNNLQILKKVLIL